MRSILKKQNVTFNENVAANKSASDSVEAAYPFGKLPNPYGVPQGGLPFIQNPPNYEQASLDLHQPVRSFLDDNFSTAAHPFSR